MHSSGMRTTRLLPGGLPDRDPPRQRALLDRDPLDRDPFGQTPPVM